MHLNFDEWDMMSLFAFVNWEEHCIDLILESITITWYILNSI